MASRSRKSTRSPSESPEHPADTPQPGPPRSLPPTQPAPLPTPPPAPLPSPGAAPSAPRERRARHLALGAEGEDRAAASLAARGYRIVARNVRAGGVELDLIARRGRTVVFVEVKTRRGSRFGPPEQAVDPRKQRRIVRGAAAWLSEQRFGPALTARFDVMAWVLDGAPEDDAAWTLRHIESAFDASAERL